MFTNQCRYTFHLFIIASFYVVFGGGEEESAGGLSHGCSRGLSSWRLLRHEDMLGGGPTQKTHFSQAEGETRARDGSTKSSPQVRVSW